METMSSSRKISMQSRRKPTLTEQGLCLRLAPREPTDYVFPAMEANVIYEGTYLLGSNLARPLFAQKQIEISQNEDTNIVTHSATDKDYDQV